MRQAASKPNSQYGVGMIEVLVAVLVVSVAILGLAALQAKSLSANNSTMARSMATVMTYSILDAMRVDRMQARNGAYNTSVKANACPDTGASLAEYQLHVWCEQLGHNLGAVKTTRGRVNCVNDKCSVTITFDDSRTGAGGSASQTVVTRATL